ncbi:DUF4062 domain-containing protein [Oscillospiraceae bacterium OttesenSCG-928-G22]|nr:DUF4062 domain-containing protein [Oscillospiraceae bacterium OttesenSCG-928-G22]
MSNYSGLARTPSIFISSTCYDLRQIRTDIKQFVETQLGYEAILSESSSFPLDPNKSTVDNCVRIVQERADIFVLIIGGRYGSQLDNGKSVTNLEYIHAAAKGIPIYVFIEKGVLSSLKIWKDNPSGNFSSVVDSPKLFEFVDSLHSSGGIWTYSFEVVQEIISALQMQLGYLFSDCLRNRQKMLSGVLTENMSDLTGEALNLVLEKPFAWENLLASCVLENGLISCASLKRDYTYNYRFEVGRELNDIHEIINWVQRKNHDMLRYLSILEDLITKRLVEAFGPSGEEGNAEEIVYTCERIIELYKSVLIWVLEYSEVSVDEEYQNFLNASKELGIPLVEKIEEFFMLFRNKTKELKESAFDESFLFDINVVLPTPDLSNFYAEFQVIKDMHGIN